MSKKKVRQAPRRQPKRWHQRRGVRALALLMSLCIAGVILARWGGTRWSPSPGRAPAPAALPVPSPNSPSKEYIYAGTHLVATEEPGGGGSSTLAPPSSLTATNISATQVNLNWTPSTGGTVDHYQVERSQNISSGYAVVAANVPTNSYSDTSVASGSAYLYRVRGVDPQGNLTGYSNLDLATAMTFIDDPLQAGFTPIKAQHITELRQATNAVRALANLPAAGWTNTVQQGARIYAVDVQELRTNLDQARSALGLPGGSYTDQPLGTGTRIRKAHLDELRQAVK